MSITSRPSLIAIYCWSGLSIIVDFDIIVKGYYGRSEDVEVPEMCNIFDMITSMQNLYATIIGFGEEWDSGSKEW